MSVLTSVEEIRARARKQTERIAVETYRGIISFFWEKDPTSRRLVEEILATEEEHADELAKLLAKIEPADKPETQTGITSL